MACVLVGLLACLPWLGGEVAAWYHFRAARAELGRYHNPQAIAHLQACLKTWPHDPDVLLLAARAARRAGAFDEAAVGLEKYQRLRGSDEAGDLERILLHAQRGAVDRVAWYCRPRVDRNDPATPLILEALVEGLVRSYRLPEALEYLRRWQERDPDNVQAIQLRASIWKLYQKDYWAADDYREVLRRDPDHDEGRLGLAEALVRIHAFDEAQPHLDTLRRRHPRHPLVHVLLARCREQQGDPAEAERLLEEVLGWEPHLAAALAARGRLAAERGQWEAAERWLRDALARAPGDHEARFHLVACLRRLGRSDEAREQDERLHALERDRKRLYEIQTTDLARRPHDPALLCELGEILLRGGSPEEGARMQQEALRHDPHFAPAHRALAVHYEKSGDREQAAEHRRLVPGGKAETGKVP
jgi:tetratricopeptide (TPR) repeat protein